MVRVREWRILMKGNSKTVLTVNDRFLRLGVGTAKGVILASFHFKSCKLLFIFCIIYYCRAILCVARLLPSPGVRPSVCLSVCPSRSGVAPKRIKISSKFFSPSGSDTIPVFPYQRECRYSDGNPPNGGVECNGV